MSDKKSKSEKSKQVPVLGSPPKQTAASVTKTTIGEEFMPIILSPPGDDDPIEVEDFEDMKDKNEALQCRVRNLEKWVVYLAGLHGVTIPFFDEENEKVRPPYYPKPKEPERGKPGRPATPPKEKVPPVVHKAQPPGWGWVSGFFTYWQFVSYANW